MYIQQSDLFKGMKRSFIKEVMDNMEKKEYEEGAVLFNEGDEAAYFYVLLKGRIKLSPGEGDYLIYVVNKPGEAFGWSSLVDRDTYTAMAQCLAPTKIIRIQRKALRSIIDKDPESGVIFYRRVAGLIGQRLRYSYDVLNMAHKGETAASFGTGQILESSLAL